MHACAGGEQKEPTEGGQEQEEEEEEEQDAEGTAEGGEEGAGGAEGVEGATATAAPALQREPSESAIPRPVFPLKHHVTITLPELPKEVS